MREGQKVFKNVQAEVTPTKFKTYYAYLEEGNTAYLMLHEDTIRKNAIRHFKGVAKREGGKFDEEKVYVR